MRLKPNIQFLHVGAEYFLIDAETENINLTDLYAMNEATADLWKHFSGRDFTAEEMANHLCEDYDITPEQALSDVRQMIAQWTEYGLIC